MSARQRIELLRLAQASCGPQLTFADHVHELNVSKDHRGRREGLEPHHRLHLALDRSMVLFDDVVEVLGVVSSKYLNIFDFPLYPVLVQSVRSLREPGVKT